MTSLRFDSVVIEDDAVAWMLHGRVLDRGHVIAFVGVVLPGEIGFGVCRVDNSCRQLPRWWRWWKAGGRVGIVVHRGLFRFVMAPSFAQVCVNEIDAPSGFFLNLVEY